MTWRDNMFFESSSKPKAKLEEQVGFTKIIHPDLERFNLSSLDDDHVAFKRAYDMAGSDRSLREAQCERINVKDFQVYTRYNPEAEAEKVVYFATAGRSLWPRATIRRFSRFLVNSICTSKGGAHVDYIMIRL